VIFCEPYLHARASSPNIRWSSSRAAACLAPIIDTSREIPSHETDFDRTLRWRDPNLRFRARQRAIRQRFFPHVQEWLDHHPNRRLVWVSLISFCVFFAGFLTSTKPWNQNLSAGSLIQVPSPEASRNELRCDPLLCPDRVFRRPARPPTVARN